jgi:hypothetical protein
MESSYLIIERFYKKFKYRRNNNNTKKHQIPPKKEEIQIQKMYLRNTIFSKTISENIVKKMIVLKYCYKNDIITLNVLYEDYSDIFLNR